MQTWQKVTCGLTLLVCSAMGCGAGSAVESSRTAASGVVTLDGQPLPGGSITLTSANDPQLRVTAMIQRDGTFSVADAPNGPVLLGVETETLRFGAPSELYVPIPPRYASAETSGLTSIVEPNGEPLNVTLQP